MSRLQSKLTPLSFAGYATIALVWYIGAQTTAQWAGASGPLIVHTACAIFALTFMLGDLSLFYASRPALVGLQALAAMLVLAVAQSSAAPILNIVLITHAVFTLGRNWVIALAVVINVAQFLIMLKVWGWNVESSLLSTLLYGCFQVFAFLIARFAMATEAARQELACVNSELLATRSLLEESARDRERLRVSRELHDVAGHTLTALKLNLRQLRTTTTGEEQKLAAMSQALAEELLEDVRALVGNLRQHDGLDLREAITRLTMPFAAPQFELRFADNCHAQNVETAQVLLAVAREAITNVVRHARATSCTISLGIETNQLRLTIEDNGRGISNQAEGTGIVGMRERLASVGGSLRVEPRPAGGACLTAELSAAQ